MSTAQRRLTVIDRVLAAVPRYKKAIAGFVAPGIGAIGLALLPGSAADSAITAEEWRGALALMLLTSVGVALTPKNKS